MHYYGRPFVSKLVMTTLCKKWVTSRDEFHTSRDNLIHRAITLIHCAMKCTHRAMTLVCCAMKCTHRAITLIHSAMNCTHRTITALLHAKQCRIAVATSCDDWVTSRENCSHTAR